MALPLIANIKSNIVVNDIGLRLVDLRTLVYESDCACGASR